MRIGRKCREEIERKITKRRGNELSERRINVEKIEQK